MYEKEQVIFAEVRGHVNGYMKTTDHINKSGVGIGDIGS